MNNTENLISNQQPLKLNGAPFVVKTYQLLNDPNNKDFISWSPTKDSFIVWKPIEFSSDILPKYFKTNNLCSFIRQLNTYGFRKVDNNGKFWEFKHDLFKEGEIHLLPQIIRRKSKKRDTYCEDIKDDNDESCFLHHSTIPLENNNNKFKSEDISDIEELKGINNILLKEIVRLQKQQETTEGTVKRILEELVESKREQITLQNKIQYLTKEIELYKLQNNYKKELESFKRSKLITDSEEQNHHSNKKIPINFFINQNHSSNLDELENLSQLDITSSDFKEFHIPLENHQQSSPFSSYSTNNLSSPSFT
jgi:heat shock transcription factor